MLYSLDVDAPGVLTEAKDADLVRLIAASPHGEDQEAEAELYRRFAQRVRLYGLRHLRDEQAAADLAQQVLLITLEGLRAGRLREPEKLAAFVLGTSRLVAMDLRRGLQRRQRLLDRFAGELAGTAPWIPFTGEDRLARCLERLAERERSVVLLSFYDEQTSSEVAQFLELSIANVRVIRHRALHRLRECMA